MKANTVTAAPGYRLDSGHVLDLHPDGVRIAAGVFEVYLESAGAEEAMARAIVAYQTWLERFAAEERRRAVINQPEIVDAETADDIRASVIDAIHNGWEGWAATWTRDLVRASRGRR